MYALIYYIFYQTKPMSNVASFEFSAFLPYYPEERRSHQHRDRSLKSRLLHHLLIAASFGIKAVIGRQYRKAKMNNNIQCLNSPTTKNYF
jgi:hypothetical protein